MTKPNSIEIIVVLDRSGSMENIKNDMMGGFDRFIQEQRKNPGECRVTLTQFDDHHDVVYTAMPIASVPKLSLVPRGMTALYDAIGKTIVSTGERLRAMRESDRPDKVLFVIITDGGENQSREYVGAVGAAKIATMTQHQRDKYQWEFIYLGANQDSFAVAQTIGIFQNVATYQPHVAGLDALFTCASAGISSYRSSEQKTSGSIIGQQAYDSALANAASGTPNVKI